MRNDRNLFARLASLQSPEDLAEPIVVPRLVAAWLAAGPAVFRGDARAELDALCRQIDVRRRVSVAYRDGWKRSEPETAVSGATLAGLVAVLLANAGTPGDESGDDGGWGLKCANSALKALDLMAEIPAAPELRAWAVAVLDDRSRPAPPTARDPEVHP